MSFLDCDRIKILPSQGTQRQSVFAWQPDLAASSASSPERLGVHQQPVHVEQDGAQVPGHALKYFASGW